MSRTRVVILSGRSLFAEGVASRLRQHLDRVELQNVDARQGDVLEQVVAARPSTVILDATDVNIARNCPLDKLLRELPWLKVIRLDPQQDKIQVLTSEQRLADEVSDLIEVIE